jgi:transposase
MKRVNRSYTPEYRAAAVQQVTEGNRSIPAVARSLEMSAKTLGNWGFRARKGAPPVRASAGQPVSELQAEVTRLRQEVAKRRMEKEILKKVAAYFAKESM